MTEVVPAVPADLTAMAELFREMDDFYGEPNREPLEVKIMNIRSALFSDKPHAFALLAWQQLRIVGVASFSFLWPATMSTKSLYLKELYVRQAARHTGIGKLLIENLLRVAAENECSRVEWTTDHNNHDAQEFYESLGYPPLPSKIFYRAEVPSLRPSQ